ncbi:hypothetical protein Pan44_17880 [Caulifigura coniformis]|uniref:DUF2071 domain-containing protein n=2 Tax=Caulifigura coniformis TaxID=2527983 RepID=A0A517SCD1_9PLAN|nr:hypothetical protein Pan44_17880 [Caulifigura coniformis]
MYQAWRELLFLHWRFPSHALQAILPPGLTLDTFDGQGWLGVVPFFMRNIRPRWSPVVPGISNFLELNLRTYVFDETGRPGVWFLSLDANRKLAVWWARRFFGLPYHHADMTADWNRTTGHVRYSSQRRDAPPRLTCRYEYAAAGPAETAIPGTLEFFLIERYFLFALTPAGLMTGQVHHSPYECSPVDLRHWDEHLIELARLPLPGRRPDHAVVSRGVTVDVFQTQPVSKPE